MMQRVCDIRCGLSFLTTRAPVQAWGVDGIHGANPDETPDSQGEGD